MEKFQKTLPQLLKECPETKVINIKNKNKNKNN